MIKDGNKLMNNGDLIKKEVKKIISSSKIDMHRISVANVYYDDYGTKCVDIYGGYNGPGDWVTYFKQLTAIVEQMDGCYLVDLLIDVLDDVWTASFSLSKKFLNRFDAEFTPDGTYWHAGEYIKKDIFGTSIAMHLKKNGEKECYKNNSCQDHGEFTITLDGLVENIKDVTSKMVKEQNFVVDKELANRFSKENIQKTIMRMFE